MEVRGGTSYYHNEAADDGQRPGPREAAGHPRRQPRRVDQRAHDHQHQQRVRQPVLGYVNSLPWDRWERTWEFSTTLTKVRGNHTIKFGGNCRKNSDMLLQTQDNQGPRGGFTFSGAQTGSTADTAANSGIANSFASFLLDLPSGMARDLKVLDDVGSQHWAVYGFVQDKWQVSPKMTVDLGLRWEYYRSDHRPRRQGVALELQPGRQHAARVRATATSRTTSASRRTSTTSARAWACRTASTTRPSSAAGFGASTMPFPDNWYAFNYPVKQNNSYQPPNSYSPRRHMAAGFPAPSFLTIPDNGIINANAVLGQSLFYVPNDLSQGALYSWNVAFQREIDVGPDGRSGLRRQHGQRRAQPLQDQRRHGGRCRHRRPAALPSTARRRGSRTWRGRARPGTTASR